MGRFSYSSGADELVRGYQLGTSISDRRQKNKMDEEVAASLARKQEAGADYTRSMGLSGADEQARMLQEQSGGFGAEGAQATADSLNSNAKDTSKADAGLYGKYTLGDQVQDTEFTPEQTRGLNRQAAKDALGKYGEEGAKRIAQMNNEDVADMQMRGLKRAEGAEEKRLANEARLGAQYKAIAGMKDGKERDDALAKFGSSAVEALGVEGGTKLLTNIYAGDTSRMKVEEERASREIDKAIVSPEAAAKFYSEKTGTNLVVHKSSADGKTYFIADTNGDGTLSQEEIDAGAGAKTVMSFKVWGKDGVEQLNAQRPEMVKFTAMKNIEADIALRLQQEKNKAAVAHSAAMAKEGITNAGTIPGPDNTRVTVWKTKDGTPFYLDENNNRIPIPSGVEILKTSSVPKQSEAEIKAAENAKTKYGALMKKVDATKDNFTINSDGKSDAHKLALANLETHAALFPDSVPKGLTKQPAAGAKGGTIDDKPPVPNAKKAPNGKWYVQKDGKYFEVQ